MTPKSVKPDVDSKAELVRLVHRMHETEQRMRELAHGNPELMVHTHEDADLVRDAQLRVQGSENAQRKMAATHFAVFNALPAHIAVVDRDCAIVSVNNAWLRFADANGFASASRGIGENYLDICDAAASRGCVEAREMAAGIRAVLAGRISEFTMEYGCSAPSKHRVFRLTFTPIGPRAIDGAVIMHVDVTERAAAVLALAESEERFRSAFEQAAVGMSHAAPDGHYLRVNNKLCEMTGYTRPELLALNASEIVAPAEQPQRILLHNRLLSGEIAAFHAERRYVRKDGSLFWGSINATMLRGPSNEAKYFVTVIEDITSRREAQDAAREREELLRIASTITRIGGWSYDVITARLDWSDEVCSIHDVALGAVPSMQTAIAFYSPESRPVIEDALDACLRDGIPFDLQLELISTTGRRVPVRALGQAKRDDGGAIAYVHGALQDLTLSKRAEEAAIGRRDAEAASKAKSAFLATMSHEIRTPMNGIIGMIEVLGQTSLRSEQTDMVELIRDSAFSLLGIIEDILDFSKIESGRQTLERIPIDVGDLVERVCAMEDHVAARRNTSVMVSVDPEIPGMLMGDPVRLRQVLVNVVSNAIKFCAGGASRGKVFVRATIAEQDGEKVGLRIAVADNGIGISQESLARLFRPFTQADDSTTRRFGGTGLGLAICRGLVDLMGGNITVVSEPTRGSTFTVALSLDRCLEAIPSDRNQRALADVQCLIVGDLDGVAATLTLYLEYAGAIVRRVATVDSIGNLPPGLWVWLVVAGDRSGSAHSLVVEIAADYPGVDARCVVVDYERTKNLADSAERATYLAGNALTRRALISAVARVSGRLTAEPIAPGAMPTARAAASTKRGEATERRRRILVAEDNEINQKVLSRQLSLMGFVADIAGTGRAALELWRNGDHEVLLTDLQMPEMDGYALIATIRKEEAATGSRIPIVVFTGNALAEEVTRCRSLGADEFLTKPAQLAALQCALEKWLPNVHMTVSEVIPPQTLPLDIAVLGEIVGSDPTVLLEFLQEFRNGATKASREFEAACRSNAYEEAGAVTHRLKSSARTVGATGLGDICATVEAACKSPGSFSLADAWSQYEAEFLRVDAYLNNAIAEQARLSRVIDASRI